MEDNQLIGQIIQGTGYVLCFIFSVYGCISKKFKTRTIKFLYELVVALFVLLLLVCGLERFGVIPRDKDGRRVVTTGVKYVWDKGAEQCQKLYNWLFEDGKTNVLVVLIEEKVGEYQRIQDRTKSVRKSILEDQETYEKELGEFLDFLDICNARHASGEYPTIIKNVSYTEETLEAQIELLNRKIKSRRELIQGCKDGKLKLDRAVTLCDETIDRLKQAIIDIKSTQFDDATDAKEFLETEIYPKIDGVRTLDQLLKYQADNKNETLPTPAEDKTFVEGVQKVFTIEMPPEVVDDPDESETPDFKL